MASATAALRSKQISVGFDLVARDLTISTELKLEVQLEITIVTIVQVAHRSYTTIIAAEGILYPQTDGFAGANSFGVLDQPRNVGVVGFVDDLEQLITTVAHLADLEVECCTVSQQLGRVDQLLTACAFLVASLLQ